MRLLRWTLLQYDCRPYKKRRLRQRERGQTAEARKTTILQPVEQKPHLQKDRQDEKAEGYIPDEGTRKNPRKTTK